MKNTTDLFLGEVDSPVTGSFVFRTAHIGSRRLEWDQCLVHTEDAKITHRTLSRELFEKRLVERPKTAERMALIRVFRKQFLKIGD